MPEAVADRADDDDLEEEDEDDDDEEEELDEEDDEQYGLDAEFRVLERDAKEQKLRLKKRALSLDGTNKVGADIVREVMNVVQMNLDLVQATGGAMEAIEERLSDLEEGVVMESQLTEDDAKDLFALLLAYQRVIGELIKESPAGDTNDKLEILQKSTEEMVARVAEWSPMEEGELRKVVDRAIADG
jgi:hypothetical protein